MQFPAFAYGLSFRLVQETDAAFILSLRTDSNRNKHLSPTDNSLDNQVQWLRAYKEREARGKEYYFIYTDEQQHDAGLFRLYNINGNTVTAGSWLSKPGIEAFTALKADLYVSVLIFKILQFETCLIDVRNDNKKVLKYHKMFFTQTGEDEQNIYLTMNNAGFEKKYKFLMNIISPQTQL
jgi:hypothetical protein